MTELDLTALDVAARKINAIRQAHDERLPYIPEHGGWTPYDAMLAEAAVNAYLEEIKNKE